jgi:hypothetical protein
MSASNSVRIHFVSLYKRGGVGVVSGPTASHCTVVHLDMTPAWLVYQINTSFVSFFYYNIQNDDTLFQMLIQHFSCSVLTLMC